MIEFFLNLLQFSSSLSNQLFKFSYNISSSNLLINKRRFIDLRETIFNQMMFINESLTLI